MPTSLNTSYRPSIHGFRFGNDFRFELGALNFWGRCNGMAWVSLDYFNAGQAAPVISDVDYGNRPRSGPAAAVNTNGSVQLFSLQDGPWGDRPTGRLVVGGTFTRWNYCTEGEGRYAPAVATWPSGRTHMLLVGMDERLYHCDFNGVLSDQSRSCNGLPGFRLIEGVTAYGPALAAPYDGRLEAYVVGKDDQAMYFRYFEGASWSDWAALGQPQGIRFTSNPAAVGWRGFMVVVARGSDEGLWARSWQDGSWQSWKSLGGRFTSGPAACKVWDGRLHVFGRGLDGAVYFSTFDGRWEEGWQPLGRPPVELTPDAPAAVGGRGFIHVYARATDETFWRIRWEEGTWRAWERIHAEATPESRRLTDAILERMLATTHGPLFAATAPLGIGLPFLGPVRNYVTWRSPDDNACFQWSSTDELRKLIRILRTGRPIPLGLIGYNGWGHEVVAYGLESSVDIPPGADETAPLPGGRAWHVKVYDPKYPACDSVVITLDPNSTHEVERNRINRIRSSTGDLWRGFFVRDDYAPATPPV